jgi:hypothetical protein
MREAGSRREGAAASSTVQTYELVGIDGAGVLVRVEREGEDERDHVTLTTMSVSVSAWTTGSTPLVRFSKPLKTGAVPCFR